MELCIVMPAYNEEACIGQVVSSWLTESALADPQSRLIVINDGSRDRTGEILNQISRGQPRLVVIHQKNTGHGGAILTGYRRALELDSKWIFQTDADGQFKSEDFRLIWCERNDWKVVLGVRARRQDSILRKWITACLRGFLRIIFRVQSDDPNVPFRLIKSRFLSECLGIIPKTVFAPNIFITILGEQNLAAVRWIPVTHFRRKTGTGSLIPWKLLNACVRALGELIVFRFSLYKGDGDVFSFEPLNSSEDAQL